MNKNILKELLILMVVFITPLSVFAEDETEVITVYGYYGQKPTSTWDSYNNYYNNLHRFRQYAAQQAQGAGTTSAAAQKAEEEKKAEEVKEKCIVVANSNYAKCASYPKTEFLNTIRKTCSKQGQVQGGVNYLLVNGGVSYNFYQICKDIAQARLDVFINDCEIKKANTIAYQCN